MITLTEKETEYIDFYMEFQWSGDKKKIVPDEKLIEWTIRSNEEGECLSVTFLAEDNNETFWKISDIH